MVAARAGCAALLVLALALALLLVALLRRLELAEAVAHARRKAEDVVLVHRFPLCIVEVVLVHGPCVDDITHAAIHRAVRPIHTISAAPIVLENEPALGRALHTTRRPVIVPHGPHLVRSSPLGASEVLEAVPGLREEPRRRLAALFQRR